MKRSASVSGIFTFRRAYLLFMLAILVGLPLSKYVASASQILLLLTWLTEARFKEKWLRFRERPAILIFCLLFIMHLAGLIYTRDWSYAWHDLKIKLPLLILPVILGTIDPVNEREKKILLGGFVVAVLTSVAVGLLVLSGVVPYHISNFREISVFISHIRFALMIDLAVFILFYYAFIPGVKTSFRVLLVGTATFLTGFLLLLESLTGLVVLVLGGLVLAIRWTRKQKDLMTRWFLFVGISMVPLLILLYLSNQVDQFYTVRDDLSHLDHQTVNGNPYWNDTTNTKLENGHFVGLYVCEPEMRRSWNRISKINYKGTDSLGQEIRYTLRRYLTSKGYRKDSVGVNRLDSTDIRLIESGYANCRYRNKNRFSNRIYELIWEIDNYRKGGNPSGHSVTQRLEYLRTGWLIFMDHPLIGVGTGDVAQAFKDKYKEIKTRLEPQWQLRTHNQFLTFAITFGGVGFLLFLFSVIYPAVLEQRFSTYFFLMFILTVLLSMLNEDTLETQAGVAFFAFFYSFFTFCDGTE